MPFLRNKEKGLTAFANEQSVEEYDCEILKQLILMLEK
jgi:hypothetical protein